MDLIMHNGKILGSEVNSFSSAIAIDKGKIVSVGSDQDILALASGKTKVLNLDKKLVLPGFIDSHMHLLNYGITLQEVRLDDITSINEMIQTVKRFIEDNSRTRKAWIKGRGWSHEKFAEKRLPNKYDLDQISTEYPIVLSRVCGHILVTNSKAMELAGVHKNTPQMDGGFFDIDSSGEPLGIFRENAMQLILDKIPSIEVEEIKGAIKLAANELLKFGITSVHSDDFVVLPNNYQSIIKAYEELIKENELPIKVYEQANFKSLEVLKDFFSSGYSFHYGNEYFRIGPLKLLTDGSLGGRTAALREPYTDDTTTSGITIFKQEILDNLVYTAHINNMPVALHAIGDQAIDMAITSIERAQALDPKPLLRHSIIHCQITDKKLLDRMKEVDISANIQPLFVSTDLHFVEDRVGAIRAETSYNWKSMLERGIHLSCSSDTPVETPNVLYGLYALVTRKDLNGYPENGFLPNQKLTLDQAINCYTMGSAYASYEEGSKGSITPGKTADLTVLSEDIFQLPPDKIKDAKVLMTFVNGNLVYKKA